MFQASVVQLARTFPCQGKGRRFEPGHSLQCAGVVELVDTQDLKSCGRKAVSVQVRSPVPEIKIQLFGAVFLSIKKSRIAGFLEATGGIEPPNRGFADPCLTTWLRGHGYTI